MLRISYIAILAIVHFTVLSQQKAFLKKAQTYSLTNIDSAYKYAKMAVADSTTGQTPINTIKALSLQYRLAINLGYTKMAASLFRPLYSKIYDLSNDSIRNYYLANAMSQEGVMHFNLGNNNKADSCYKRAITVASDNGFLRINMVTHINRGLVKRSEGNLHSSYELYSKALLLSDSVGDYDMRFSILCMLGQILVEVGSPDKGIKYLNKAGEIKDSASYIGYVSEWKSDLGYAWFNKNNLDSSLFYYQQANKIALDNNLAIYEALASTNIGELYLNMDSLTKAKINIDRGLHLAQKLSNMYIKFYSLSLLGEYFYLKKNYSKAQWYFNNAESMVKNMDVIVELQKRHYKRVYIFNKAIGNNKKALKAFEKFKSAEQTILGKETAWKIAQMERTLDVAEKEKVIANQKQELTIHKYNLQVHKSRNWIYSMVSFSIVIILISIIIINQINRRKDKQLYKAEVDKIVSNYKLKNIQTLISPHFIFNALNNFWGVVKTKDENRAYDYLMRLSDLLRASLTNSENTTVTLSEELKFVQNFLKLEQICNQEKFSYSIDVDKDVRLDLHIIPMCVQTHVENALKHGIRPKPSKGKLSVAIKNEGNHLLAIIEDDGIGREHANKQNITTTGIGLRSQTEIIDLYNHKNEDKMTLDIIDLTESKYPHGGTRVEIRIPIKYSYSLN